MKRFLSMPEDIVCCAFDYMPPYGQETLIRIALTMQYPELVVENPICTHSEMDASECFSQWRPAGLTDAQWARVQEKCSLIYAGDRCPLSILTNVLAEEFEESPQDFLRVTQNVQLTELLKRTILPGWKIATEGNLSYMFDEDYTLRVVKDTDAPLLVSHRFPARLVNRKTLELAKKTWHEGMSLDDCIMSVVATASSFRTTSFLDRLCTKFGPPEFERDPENQNRKTFDRIRLEVGLNSSLFRTWKDLATCVKKHANEITARALETIEADKNFQRFGLPIHYIVVSDAKICKDYTIQYIFEIKPFEFAAEDYDETRKEPR